MITCFVVVKRMSELLHEMITKYTTERQRNSSSDQSSSSSSHEPKEKQINTTLQQTEEKIRHFISR
jgi:hypothetical protein